MHCCVAKAFVVVLGLVGTLSVASVARAEFSFRGLGDLAVSPRHVFPAAHAYDPQHTTPAG